MTREAAGRRVVVTAGGSGIGRVIVTRFVEAGAQVHTCDISPERLEALWESHPEVTSSLADVSKPDDVDQLFGDAVEQLGGLDVLVNDAGVAGPHADMEDIDVESWRRTLDVNLFSTFLCSQHAARLLKQGGTGGSIVNISSNVGLMGLAQRAPYVASKWGIIGLTRTMSLELGPFGIRVNAICPGDVEGERIERVIRMEAESRGLSRDQVAEERVAGTALHSFISPDDVACLILFLCSEGGARISGQALAVDGHVEHL